MLHTQSKKRKAVKPADGAPPSNRPKTRSSCLLDRTQPVQPFPKEHLRNGSPSTPTSKFPRTADPSGFTKRENHIKRVSGPNDFSEDEMDLLGSSPNKVDGSSSPDLSHDELDLFEPSKANTGHVTPGASTPAPTATKKESPRNPGRLMEVVITTPKSFSRTTLKVSGLVAGSPSPSRRIRNNVAIATPSREHQTQKDHNRYSPVSQISYPSPTSPHIFSLDYPSTSPNKQAASPKALPLPLPSHLERHLQYQRRAVLKALRHPPLFVNDDDSAPSSAFNQLSELLEGTTQRKEGNSCLVLGPKGSGKSRLVDRVLASLPLVSTPPVIIRLSSHSQTDDRLAMREIARQVHRQVGSDCSLPSLPNKEEEPEEVAELDDGQTDVNLPPPSLLPTLVSALPALGRPVIVVLDAFDGFAAHARQALLYCLLDTVQSCRGGAPTPHETDTSMVQPNNDLAPPESDQPKSQHKPEQTTQETAKGEHGLLVIGITSRVDCLTLLEKRVKSRFSHRVMRVRTLARLEDFLKFAKGLLCVDSEYSGPANEEWKELWSVSVEVFLANKDALKVLKETFAFSKDLRVPCRVLTSPVLALTPSSPWLLVTHLLASVSTQRCPKHFPFLSSLSYPHIALLIAAAHARTSGQDTFNFEMLYDAFTAQVRTSAAAPVQIAGGAIGMVKVSRGIMVGAFEHLAAVRVFQPVAAPAAHITREFVRYLCVAERDEIKAAVDRLGQTNLKRWFTKAQ